MENIKVQIVSNKSNNSTEEILIHDNLKDAGFDVDQKDLNSPELLKFLTGSTDILLLRNLWPIKENLNKIIALSNLQCPSKPILYNPINSDRLSKGKEYLVSLTQLGFPVIPTIHMEKFEPNCFPTHDFILKPQIGCSSVGIKRIVSDEIQYQPTQKCLLQPFINFENEASFFFIDKRFVYALISRTKVDFKNEHSRWDLVPWQPSNQQIQWAEKFVLWNAVPFGLERIDAGLTENGELLLIEIEDLAPFLSLECLPINIKNRFFDHLVQSLKQVAVTNQ